jgi:hypothetical protein
MQPRPDITPLLKKLRLSGMLESLEIRNKQAISDKIGLHRVFIPALK